MASITKVTTHFLADLPDEVSLNILSKLDMKTLGRFCLVSQWVNRLASDDSIWTILFSGDGIPKTGVKAHIASHCVLSDDQLVRRVRAFAEKIQWGQKGRLNCKYHHLPDCDFTIRFISGELPRENHLNIPAVMCGEDEYALTDDIICLEEKREDSELDLCMKNSGYPQKTFLMILGTGVETEVTKLGDIIKSRLDDLRKKRENPEEMMEPDHRSMLTRFIDAFDALNDDPRFQRIDRVVTIAAVALSVFVIGAYFVRNR